MLQWTLGRPQGLQPTRLLCSWDSSGKNSGVGSLSLLQGILPIQELKPNFLHCRQIPYQVSQKGSPRKLEWVASPFSSRSSWPRNQTEVSCIAGGFFTNWAMREATLAIETSYNNNSKHCLLFLCSNQNCWVFPTKTDCFFQSKFFLMCQLWL